MGVCRSADGDGDAAGLLGVIGKVTLSVHIGMIADDLYGVLVGANGTVGTQAIELAGNGAFGSGVDARQGREVLVTSSTDAYGEVVLGIVVSLS